MSYKKHQNFLSEDELTVVVEDSHNYLSNPDSTYRTNFTCWEKDIIKDSNVVLLKNIWDSSRGTKEDIESVNVLCKKFEKMFGSIPTSMSFFYWSPGSYIPWHDDPDRSRACTLYLNNQWDPMWGGFFSAYEDNDPIMIKPELNLCIEQTNNIIHCTTPTTEFSRVRITLQSFWSET